MLTPPLYNLVQNATGLHITMRRIAPFLAGFEGGRVVDVGGGTGLWAPAVPRSARYLCLDIDRARLSQVTRKHGAGSALQSDAARIGLRSQSFDCGLCIAVSHHLDDAALPLMFAEIARVVTKRLVFVDPILWPESRVSRLLWRLDAGEHPRSQHTLLEQLSRFFVVEHTETYEIYHRYLLCVATPRAYPPDR